MNGPNLWTGLLSQEFIISSPYILRFNFMAHFRFSIRIVLQVFFILYIILHWKFDLEIGLLLNKKTIDIYLQPEPIHVEHSSPKSFSFLFILIEKIDIFK